MIAFWLISLFIKPAPARVACYAKSATWSCIVSPMDMGKHSLRADRLNVAWSGGAGWSFDMQDPPKSILIDGKPIKVKRSK